MNVDVGLSSDRGQYLDLYLDPDVPTVAEEARFMALLTSVLSSGSFDKDIARRAYRVVFPSLRHVRFDFDIFVGDGVTGCDALLLNIMSYVMLF